MRKLLLLLLVVLFSGCASRSVTYMKGNEYICYKDSKIFSLEGFDILHIKTPKGWDITVEGYELDPDDFTIFYNPATGTFGIKSKGK